jgi:signal transduction histidine kinase
VSTNGADKRLTAVLRAAQYLSNLTLLQDPWTEWAQAMKAFFSCDLMMVVRPSEAGAFQIAHAATGTLSAEALLAAADDEISAVLESGFLGSLTLAKPACALAVLPLTRDRRIAAVAIIGRSGADSLSTGDLEILLALGSLFGNVVARTETERELRTYQQNLEKLIADRTRELEATNARLVLEIAERQRAESERRRAEAGLLQAQKMDSLGSLAGGVAHDMNNVLAAILSLASAHLTIQPPESRAYLAFKTIQDAALRGAEMVKRLLNFARQSPVESRLLDLNALLQEEARLLERTTLAKVNLTLDLFPDLHPIQGDASALTHALMNLCVNSVDAMAQGGQLTITSRNLGEDQVEISVVDTGAGMTEEVLARALDPFFTTKEVGKGTGLGLPLVYNAVNAHRGTMTLASQPGQGTQVTLRFPAALVANAVLLAKPQVRPERAITTLNILLVDDDELIQVATSMLIGEMGHKVTQVASGEEALALLKGGACPDIVILDMNMPGLGGKGTLPRLRALCPALPVLLSTGRIDQDALDLVATYAHVNLLSKPFTIGDLRSCLEHL